MAEPHRRGHQHLDEIALGGPVHRQEPPRDGVTGVVDQDVRAQAGGFERPADLLRRVGPREIGGQHQDLDPMARGEFTRQGFQPVAPPGDEGKIAASRRIGAGEGGPDPRGGPGHKGEAVWIRRLGHGALRGEVRPAT